MRSGKATGLQLAFLIFAVMFLAAPLTLYVGRKLEMSADWTGLLGRTAQLALLGLALFAVERYRPGLIKGLLGPVPHDRRTEVGLVAVAEVFFPFALFGGMMLWHWLAGGPLAVERRFPTDAIHLQDQAFIFSATGMLLAVVSVTLAPLVEEIAFRGLLYGAWERVWGWVPAMVLTAALFGLYHHNFVSAFIGSIVFVCVYRRTGTLLAPMFVHAVGNAFAWYPLGGQFYVPSPALPVGDLATWRFHLAALTVFIMAIPAYLFMARDSRIRSAAA
jgi:uncharacterized protein